MLLSSSVICDSKKPKFREQHEASRLLSSLEIKTTLSKISLVGSLFFKSFQQFNTMHKMNEIVSKFLLAGAKFMPEIYLRQPGLTYSACGPFTKNKERIQKLKKQEIPNIFIITN